MKTKLLILLLILSAVLLTASTPAKTQTIYGTLEWTRSSICGLQDYVVTPAALGKIYLTGSGFPTSGELKGCSIRAEGYFMKENAYCRVFSVQRAILSCPVSLAP